LVAAVLAACGGGTEEGTETTAPTTTAAAATAEAETTAAATTEAGAEATTEAAPEEPLTFAIAVAQITDTYFQTMICGARDKAEELGITLNEQGAQQYDPSQLIPIVDAIYQTKPDGFILAPSDPKALVPPVQRFVDDGIPVVTTDVPLENDEQYTLGNLLSDNYAHGKLAGEAIASLFPDPTTIVALGIDYAPGLIQTNDRVKGWYDAITAAGGQVLPAQFGTSDPNKAKQIVEAALRGNPDINAIMFIDGLTGDGGRTAIKQLDLVGDVKVAEFQGASDQQLQGVRSGTIDALVSQSPYLMGSGAVELLYDYIQSGEKPPYEVQELGAIIITKENIGDPESKPYILSGFAGC
jgi:ribose transport system substrate-binding protein